MRRIEAEGGGYKLVADEGKRLVIVDEEGNKSYTDEVLIPTGVTLNKWDEAVPEIEPEPTEEEFKQQRIAELEAELSKLKGE